MSLIRSVPVLGLVAAFSASCGSEEDEGANTPIADQQAELSLAGKRCTVRGEPALTQGCTADEVCIPYACTNSIPPSCVGRCRAQPKLPKGERCDVTGDPPTTSGCADAERCVVEACTNSIPPHCFGHCGP